jgi:hypothetical protein
VIIGPVGAEPFHADRQKWIVAFRRFANVPKISVFHYQSQFSFFVTSLKRTRMKRRAFARFCLLRSSKLRAKSVFSISFVFLFSTDLFKTYRLSDAQGVSRNACNVWCEWLSSFSLDIPVSDLVKMKCMCLRVCCMRTELIGTPQDCNSSRTV